MMEDSEILDRTRRFLRSVTDEGEESTDEQVFSWQTSGAEWSLCLDWAAIERYDESLAAAYTQSPDQTREIARRAVSSTGIADERDVSRVTVQNLPTQTPIPFLGAPHIGTLVSVQGRLTAVGPEQHRADEAAFECPQCGTVSVHDVDVSQPSTSLAPTPPCQHCGAMEAPILLPDESTLVPYQEAIVVSMQDSQGRPSPSLTVVGRGPLVGGFVLGQYVRLTGVLRWPRTDHNCREASDTMWLDIDHIETVSPERCRYPDLIGTSNELPAAVRTVQKIAADRDRTPLQTLVSNLAPSVFGYETAKRAIVLQFASGVSRAQQTGVPSRGAINILICAEYHEPVGRLLDAALEAAPHSVRTYESQWRKQAVEPLIERRPDDGLEITDDPVVAADRGVFAIEGVEKMPIERQQELGDIIRRQTAPTGETAKPTLDVRSGVLATYRPPGGRWDQYQPIPQQIELEPTLYSTFDLVLNSHEDLSPNQTEGFARKRLKILSAGADQPDREVPAEGRTDPQTGSPDGAVEPPSTGPQIDSKTLRQYLTYARHQYRPTLDADAQGMLREFYAEIQRFGDQKRESAEVTDAPPVISSKLLGTLRRLTEASARIRLSSTGTTVDAERAVDVVTASLNNLGVRIRPDLDVETVSPCDDQQETRPIDEIKQLIAELSSGHNEGVLIGDVYAAAREQGYERSEVEACIDELQYRKEIYQPKRGLLSAR